MTKELLLEAIIKTLQKPRVDEFSVAIARGDLDLNDLLDLTFHHDDKAAFRAAWIFESVCLINPLKLLDCLETFISKFPQQNNPAVRRHYSKIMCLLTDKKADQILREKLAGIDLDDVIDALFTWLIAEQMPVAVKANCAEALANLVSKNEWIRDELIATIDHLVDKESVAFFARTKVVRESLKS